MCNELEVKFIDLCERNDYERVLKLGNKSDDSSEEFDGEESKRSHTIPILSDSDDDNSDLSSILESDNKSKEQAS
jgi:hypothetical protein